jgi:small conductance mechanosensitive channel
MALASWQVSLESMLNSFGSGGLVALRISVILIVAWIAIAVLQRLIRSFRIRIASRFDDPEVIKRAETLGRVFRYLVAVVVTLLAGMLVLGELGVSVAPILGAAGVVGLAVGFGAQSLVRDYFNGFFILLENQIRQGDVVRLLDHSGLVEEVTLRHVRLRDYDGHVHFVPNGQITTVVNLSRDHAYAVIDIGVAYRENVDTVIARMKAVGQDMRADPAIAGSILEPLEVAGVERWDDSAVVIRCRFKCLPLHQWTVRRWFLKSLKADFDRHGIEIPYPHVTVYAGQDRNGLAPALPVALAPCRNPPDPNGRVALQPVAGGPA